METNRYLRTDQPDRSGRMMVQLSIAWNGQRSKVSTAQKVLPADWDDEKQRVKPRAEFAAAKNKVITQVETCVANYFNRQQLAGTPVRKADLDTYLKHLADAAKKGTIDSFVAAVPGALQAEEKVIPDLFSFIETYRNHHKAVKDHDTLRKYDQIVSHLREFSIKENIFPLYATDLTLPFVLRYIDYLTNTRKLLDNTAYGHLSKLKPVLKYADRLEIPHSKDFSSWPNHETPAVKHWHTEEEMTKLTEKKYSTFRLQATADTYRLACYTALRVSDLQAFDPARHIRKTTIGGQERSVLELTHMIKTRHPVSIVLSRYAMEILQRVGDNPWRTLPYNSEQEYNETIKLVGLEAGLQRPSTSVAYRGGQRVEEVKPLYKFMTSHTARHTFACLSVMRGMPIPVLQQIMGHKDIKSTMSYVHMVDDWKHQQTINAWDD